MAHVQGKSALQALLGALAATLLCASAAWGFLEWRASEQRRALDARTTGCAAGERADCDRLRAACSRRSAEACRELARLHLDGPATLRDPAEALARLEEACQYGHAASCLEAAELHLGGGWLPRDAATARPLLERGCALGSDAACRRRNDPG